jgi:pimeloyl-ACP methyl ester carboxylesterase
MTHGRHIIAVLVTLLAIAGCSLLPGSDEPAEESTGNPSATAPTADLTSYYRQSVRWSRCGGDFRCAKITVPLDYADPAGSDLQLQVIRHPATSKEPLGSLVVNPGGPGASGVDYGRAARAIVTPEVLKEYDIVGFDPRGVARSEPVECLNDTELDTFMATDATPDNPAEVKELAALSAEMGHGCKARSPEVAPHVDSVSVVRDIDILRAVLGDEKLNFLGKSYGSQLGALYAGLFPQQVGRVVLDGVLPNSLTLDMVSEGQAAAFDVALQRFVAWCIEDADCPLPRDQEQGMARIQKLLDDLDSHPLPGIGKRVLTQALGTAAILNYLYAPSADWVLLEYGLAAALEGDGSVLLDMIDDRTDRSEGRYTSNLNEVFFAVSCLDRPALGGVEHAEELAAAWEAEAPVFGPVLAWGTLPCWRWPMDPVTVAGADPRSREPVRAPGTAPILVVSTRYDPATPYQWGVQVADELESGHLLTYEGDGHTAYTSGSPCIDAAVTDYLISGKVPAEGASCPAIPVAHES